MVTTPTLPWHLSAAPWPLPRQDPVTSIAFVFPNSVTAVTTVRLVCRVEGSQNISKDVGALPPTNLFLVVMMKGVFLDPPSVGE